MNQIDHKRITKNTLLLYFRMGLIMLISLWTSRVVLKTLGFVDYGLYNVIGGIVVAFSFMSGALNASCNRYLAMALGSEDSDRLKLVFRSNMKIFAIMTLIIGLISLPIGLWLIQNKMNIPLDRSQSSIIVFVISIISFSFSLLSTPYKALITSKEKMKVYAYSSILEALCRLGIVFLLDKASADKLVLYAFLMLVVTASTSLFYVLYCRRYWPECKSGHSLKNDKGIAPHTKQSKDSEKALMSEIVKFNAWGMLGSLATVARSQGINIVLNLFFGPVVNAARGVANQVYVNVYQFVQNYALAFSPQIYKSFSAGQHRECTQLIFRSSKLSFYLLFLVSLPLIFEMESVMRLWLVDVPEHSVIFAQIMMCTALVDSLYTPLFNGIQASGRVKWLNILVGGTQIASVVAAYAILKIRCIQGHATDPSLVFMIVFGASVLCQFIRVILAAKLIQLPVKEYLKKVIFPILFLCIIGISLETIIVHYLNISLLRIVLSCITSFVLVGAFFLCDKRRIIISKDLFRQKE